MHKGELEVQGRKKGHVLAQAVAVLNSQQIQGIFRFGATPTSEHEAQGARRHREKPGTRTGTQKECGETQSSNRTCCIVQPLSFVGFQSFGNPSPAA